MPAGVFHQPNSTGSRGLGARSAGEENTEGGRVILEFKETWNNKLLLSAMKTQKSVIDMFLLRS